MQVGCCFEILVPSRNRALSPPVSVPTTTPPRSDAALEAQKAAAEAAPRVGDVREPAEHPERRVRDWLGAAGSARSRILIAYVVLLAIAAALGLLGFRQALLIR